MKHNLFTVFFLFVVTASYAQSNNADESTQATKEEYLMLIVQTSYGNLVAGASISIYQPNADQPSVIKPDKKEDFRVRIMKELNALGQQGWSLVNSHHRTFEVSGESGTSSEETVYIFKRKIPA